MQATGGDVLGAARSITRTTPAVTMLSMGCAGLRVSPAPHAKSKRPTVLLACEPLTRNPDSLTAIEGKGKHNGHSFTQLLASRIANGGSASRDRPGSTGS